MIPVLEILTKRFQVRTSSRL